MPLKLLDFSDPLASTTIMLRGRSVTLRAVSAAESARVREMLPRPMAPLTSLSRKGSVATPMPVPQPDEANEEHRRKLSEWSALCSIAEVGVGLEWETTDGKSALIDPKKAALELRQAFTDQELGSLAKLQDLLSGKAEEKALGNSSSPAMDGPSSGDPTASSPSHEPTPSPGPSC